MQNKLLLMVFAVIFLASCSKENDSIPTITSEQEAMMKKGPQARPFSGQMSYSFAPTENLPCDCGDYYPVGTFSGTGNLSHLGMTTSLIKPCVAPIFQDGNYIGDHVGVECAYFVAANGDSLYCYTYPYDLLYGPTGAVGVAKVDFTGGTGRFANATGSFTGTVTISPSGNATFSGLNGTLIY